jgi:mannose-1-phosphate guanylyltransferase
MKAFLLTAGLGTRLQPITFHTPKCLVPIGDQPLINWWYQSMEAAGITEVLVNLHHLPEAVRLHISNLGTSIKTHFSFEVTLLGSAGAIRANADFVKGEDAFFIIYADNLTNLSLTDLKHYHDQQSHPLTMALFHSSRPENCGIAELDENGTIIGFEEKPAHPITNLANAGIYIGTQTFLEKIPNSQLPCDIGFDVLPLFINKMSGWKTDDYIVDIGTHENLEKARKEWPLILREKE